MEREKIKNNIIQCLNNYHECHIFYLKTEKVIVIEENFYSNLSPDIIYIGSINCINNIENLLNKIDDEIQNL